MVFQVEIKYLDNSNNLVTAKTNKFVDATVHDAETAALIDFTRHYLSDVKEILSTRTIIDPVENNGSINIMKYRGRKGRSDVKTMICQKI